MNQNKTKINPIAEPFDLHLHSSCSDGSDAPAGVVRAAFARGITMLALTDHDNVLGVPEAMAEAEQLGIRLLPSIEMDAEWPHEMHILGLDIDITEQRMKDALTIALKRRGERNAVIIERLLQLGCDIRGYLGGEIGALTGDTVEILRSIGKSRSKTAHGKGGTNNQRVPEILGRGVAFGQSVADD